MRAAILLAASCLALPGCHSLLTEGTADAAGIAGAGIAGAVTKDATVGAAIGIGVTAVASAGLKYAIRRVHTHTQDTIAQVAGTMPVGSVAPWKAEHLSHLEEDSHGEVVVTRELGGGDFDCKEIVFSVEAGTAEKPERSFFIATVCRNGETWQWATAEPATSRWGGLQ